MTSNFVRCSARLRVAKRREESDIDLLVWFSKPIGWKFYGIAEDLQEVLGKKVDLATENMLNRYICESVLRDLQIIYEKAE